jgi:hypothetical protein
VTLTPDDVAALDAALRPGNVSGPRYNEQRMTSVDR